MNQNRKDGNMNRYEDRLQEVAMKGLDAVDEFLDSPTKTSSDLFRKRHLKAKIGSGAVSNQVRHMAATNMRDALEIQRERILLGGNSEPTVPALKSG